MKYKVSINVLLGLLVAVILFHFSVISKIVPYDIAWGGRLQNDSEMYVFEGLSIFFNLFLGLVLLMKGDYMKFLLKRKAIDIILWIFFALFFLNTAGNIFAKSNFEKSFAILSFIFALLIWSILRTKRANEPQKLA